MSREAKETQNASYILAKKELKLLFKSKRRIFLLSITPLMILLIGVIAVFTASTIENNTEPVNVYVVNDSPSNYTDLLLTYYSNVENTEFSTLNTDFNDVQEGGNFHVMVHIPSNFTAAIQANQTATVDIVYNTNSSSYQRVAIGLSQLTEIYEQQVLVQEPQPDLLVPVLSSYKDEDATGLSVELASNLFIIPVYIIFFVVIPPISLVMISVTIEREEKTLETLFLQPVTRNSIILGKILYGMGLIVSVLILDIIAIAIDYVLITQFIAEDAEGELSALFTGVTDLIGIDLILFFFAVIILISVAVVGLAVLLSLLAKDEREANLISGVLPMAIFSIIFLVQAVDITELNMVTQLLFMVIPVMGILLAFYVALVAGSLTLPALISIVAQVIWIFVIITFTARLSESESILELSFTKVSDEILKFLRIRK